MGNPLFVLSLSLFGRAYLKLLLLSMMREHSRICLTDRKKLRSSILQHSPTVENIQQTFQLDVVAPSFPLTLKLLVSSLPAAAVYQNYSPHPLIQTSSPMGLQDYASANGGIVSLILRFLVRFLQFIFAFIVVGLYGFRLDNERKAEQYVSSHWVYAVGVGGLSAITCIIYMLPPVHSYSIFGWTLSSCKYSLM